MLRTPQFFVLALCCTAVAGEEQPSPRFIGRDADNKLVYERSPRGDRMPDFSYAGFGGGEPIPRVAVAAVVPPAPGECGARIQAAIDDVAGQPVTAGGVRGAVLLPAGRFEIAGSIKLASGVVLRGAGEGTILMATGQSRRAVIQICGGRDQTLAAPLTIADDYVPVGSQQLRLISTAGLGVGDTVVVEHPSTKRWIAALGMDRFPSRDKGSYLDWRPGTLDLRWDRIITQIEGNQVTLDAPLTAALDQSLSLCQVRKYSWPSRLRRAGVENLRIESAFHLDNPRDEEHAWTGVVIENAEDVWVRRVSFAHLAGSAVAIWETARRVTVADCKSAQPISEVGGHRRQTFFTAGQQTLFLRCRAEDGRRDFTTGHLACGPSAFVDCRAVNAHGFSGPSGSWASGVLFDNVEIDGGGLVLTNRETDDQGVGWAAANCVLWQCAAPLITCRAPPTAQNWAIGVWGQFVGDGHWRELNEFASPRSLFAQQLQDRLGKRAAVILESQDLTTETPDPSVKRFTSAAHDRATKADARKHHLSLTNGWLAIDGALLTGRRTGTAWWRGHTLPARESEVGIGLTRYVPGRTGAGATDDLAKLSTEVKANGVAALDHHWGLWYDRRRDDHQMLRRMDGDVWAPFYELPWARSGRGRAWDGLSKYDLTQFNSWYFSRLAEFADECERQGLVLVQQMYFQHNILEAGAHWADFPWRPANCLQATGFPEPPTYVGGKRVFMADAFYDVSHPVRRELHRHYIRHCLDCLGHKPNMLFQTGEEFTGPLPFVQFWIDTVAEWCREQDRQVLIGLSCTKDVQDAILADDKRAKLIAVIDLKYWWHTPAGQTYNPPGGANLAPRQQLREWRGSKSQTAESIARAVREYRTRFPGKAVTASLDGADGWAVLAAGGSLPRLPQDTNAKLKEAVFRMRPVNSSGDATYVLADPQQGYLAWSPTGREISIDLSAEQRPLTVHWIDHQTGAIKESGASAAAGRVVTLRVPDNKPATVWLTRQIESTQPK